MIAVEYDGEEHHTSRRTGDRTRERRAWLRNQGWIIIVVTKHDLAVAPAGRVDRASFARRGTSGSRSCGATVTPASAASGPG